MRLGLVRGRRGLAGIVGLRLLPLQERGAGGGGGGGVEEGAGDGLAGVDFFSSRWGGGAASGFRRATGRLAERCLLLRFYTGLCHASIMRLASVAGEAAGISTWSHRPPVAGTNAGGA